MRQVQHNYCTMGVSVVSLPSLSGFGPLGLKKTKYQRDAWLALSAASGVLPDGPDPANIGVLERSGLHPGRQFQGNLHRVERFLWKK
jgi:hypothetical protein